MNKDNGIAINEIMEVLQFIKKMNKIRTTKNEPSSSVSCRFSIEDLMKFDCLK